MTKFMNLARSLHNDESGVALLEYTILLGIIAVAVIGTVVAVGSWTNSKWTIFNSTLQNAP